MPDEMIHTDVLVLGLGNELLCDDGVGVHVVRMLREESPTQGVLIAEAGTAILRVQHLLERTSHVIAIDAVRAGDKPGTVYCFDIDQAHINYPASLHDLGIVGLLQLIPVQNRPKVTILGIEPEMIDYGMELSATVQATVAGVCQLVKKMILERRSRKAECIAGS